MKFSLPEIVVCVLVIAVCLVPTDAPVPPPAVEPPTPPAVEPTDLLDTANAEVRAALADLLLVYVGEDLTDSKYFDQFSAELSRVQADAFLPVAKAICDSDDLASTSEAVSNHSLGSN